MPAEASALFRPPGSQTAYYIPIPIPCIFFHPPSLSLYVYIHTYIHTYTHTQIYIYIYIHTYVLYMECTEYTHTHIYIYIHIGKSESNLFGPFSYHKTAIVSWLCFGRGTFMHYSNIYSFGRSVAQRLRVVDSTEQYKLKNNRLRQFERALAALTKKVGCWSSRGCVFFNPLVTLW